MDCGNIQDIAQDGLSADCKYGQDELQVELNPLGLV